MVPSANMHYDLRPAIATDCESMVNIYRPYIETGFASFEEEVPSLEEFNRRRMHYQETAPWLVARYRDLVIGYAYAAPHRGRPAYRWTRELSIYIQEQHQTHGVGQALYTALITVLAWQGYTNVLAGVALPNGPSERFHEKMGFAPIGTYHRIGFKHGVYCEVRWYERFIGDPDVAPGKVQELEHFWESALWKDTKLKALAYLHG